MSSTNGHKANGLNGHSQGKGRGGNVPPVEHQFKPGKSGNPQGGRVSSAPTLTTAIRDLVKEGLEGHDLSKALARVAIQKALSGDIRFYQLVIERLDGKVPDQVQQDGLMEILVRYHDAIDR